MSNWTFQDLASVKSEVTRKSAMKQLGHNPDGAMQIWLKNPNISPDMPEDPAKDRSISFRGEVQKLLSHLGYEYHHQAYAIGSKSGWPDLSIWHRPKKIPCFFAELKTQTGTLSKNQKNFIHSLKEATNQVYVWRPSDWPEIVQILYRMVQND